MSDAGSPPITEAEFDAVSWHDGCIYGFALRLGNPAAGDWSCDLVLDIDYISEWVPGSDGMRFQVAPATLVFHGLTDLRVHFEWGPTEFRGSPDLLSIDRIERERIVDAKVFLDRPYYHWRIRLNAPPGGEIGFGAFGFTQTLRSAPQLSDEQRLSAAQRAAD